MKKIEVLEAARLIDQLTKLDQFIRQAPPQADILTLTFRKGIHSKSMTLRDYPTIIDIREIITKIRDDTEKSIKDFGVEI